MPFNRKPQKFNASIKEVTIGCGENAVTLGGENVFPFYTFDGDMKNATNLVNNSFVKTFGYNNINDGGGSFYKIRNITNKNKNKS